jgi:hypothetical protein
MFAEKPQLQERPYRKALPARKSPQPFEFLELENGVDFQGKLHWLHPGIPG